MFFYFFSPKSNFQFQDIQDINQTFKNQILKQTSGPNQKKS
jgi:hypothetical protein